MLPTLHTQPTPPQATVCPFFASTDVLRGESWKHDLRPVVFRIQAKTITSVRFSPPKPQPKDIPHTWQRRPPPPPPLVHPEAPPAPPLCARSRRSGRSAWTAAETSPARFATAPSPTVRCTRTASASGPRRSDPGFVSDRNFRKPSLYGTRKRLPPLPPVAPPHRNGRGRVVSDHHRHHRRGTTIHHHNQGHRHAHTTHHAVSPAQEQAAPTTPAQDCAWCASDDRGPPGLLPPGNRLTR